MRILHLILVQRALNYSLESCIVCAKMGRETKRFHLPIVPIVENTMLIQPVDVCAIRRYGQLDAQSHPYRSQRDSLDSDIFAMQPALPSPTDGYKIFD